MDAKRFSNNSPGRLAPCQNAAGNKDWAFVPHILPPAWQLDSEVWPLVAEARAALGELNGIGQKLPNPQLLLRPLQQQEAITSSRIEGTYVTAKQLLMYELAPPDPRSTDSAAADWQEVFNYTLALRHGWCQLTEGGLPFCFRIICEMHEILMRGVRGEGKSPGKFRTVPAQVGSTARFIPAPWREITPLMSDLEKYMNSDSENFSIALVKCFIAHYQFEAIHPFEDGNGRVGRALLALMISVYLGHAMPWLYLSAFFERYRDEYVSRLFAVSTDAEWGEWIKFCLIATVAQANDSIKRVARLSDLKASFHSRLTAPSSRSHDIIEFLFSHPVLTVVSVRDKLGISYNTARRDLDRLAQDGIIQVLPEAKTGKTYFSPDVMRCAFEELEAAVDIDNEQAAAESADAVS